MTRPDPGQALLDARLRRSTSLERTEAIGRWRRVGVLKVWQQADAAGPMSELERAEFLLRRLYPSFPEVQLRQILDQLAMAEAAGDWSGLRRPEPIADEDGN